MIEMPRDSNDELLRFSFGDLSPNEFSAWLGTEGAGRELGEEVLVDLVSFDYADPDEAARARRHARAAFETRYGIDPEKAWVARLTGAMISNAVRLENGCKALADLEADGCKYVPRSLAGLCGEVERLGLAPYRERLLTELHLLRGQLRAVAASNEPQS